MPFHGNHDHTLDAKNRLTIPARSRSQLSGGVTVTKGFEPCLQIWPSTDYERIAAEALAPLNPLGPESRELKRHLYGNATATELDSAGRVNLPPSLLAHAGIDRDVVLVGGGDYLEVWSRESWQDHQTGLIDRAADHIASVGHPA